MGLFKRFRRSPEERAWKAIHELEIALKSKEPAPPPKPEKPPNRLRSFLTQLFVGLALLFLVLLAAKYVTKSLRKPEPFEDIDQQTFDLLWGAHRPGVSPNTTEPNASPPPSGDVDRPAP